MLWGCCIDLWQASPMRRKRRLTDTWLSQRVLLDSWNVTLFQGAECCTLNLSPSNNRFQSDMSVYAGCGNDRLVAEGKHIRHFVCAFYHEVTLKTSCPNYKIQVPLVFSFLCKYKYSNVEICMRANVLSDEYSRKTPANTKRGLGRNGVFCMSVGKTEPIK